MPGSGGSGMPGIPGIGSPGRNFWWSRPGPEFWSPPPEPDSESELPCFESAPPAPDSRSEPELLPGFELPLEPDSLLDPASFDPESPLDPPT